MLVAAPAAASLGYNQRLTGVNKVAQELGRLIVVHNRPRWNRDNQVRRRFSGSIGRTAVFTVFRAKNFVVLKFVQRVQSRNDLQDHAAAPASVAAVRSTAGAVFLTVHVHHSVAALAGFYCNCH
jgi:hypothetical protein